MTAATADLQRLLDRICRHRLMTGVTLAVHHPELQWTGGSGDLSPARPLFIASVTKLMTAAMVFQHIDEGAFSMSTPIHTLLPAALVEGLHCRGGVDRSAEITVGHLLSHTSGLPDYFMGRPPRSASLERQLLSGADQRWTLEDAVALSRAQRPPFPPGSGKALYSDTNYQLLGAIIEATTGLRYGEALQRRICAPLNLEQTWCYDSSADHRPIPMRDGAEPCRIPQAMMSFGPDGGVVSTAVDLMIFTRAFFEGRLFKVPLEGLQRYHRIFFPLQYGVGFMRLKLPRWMTPFQTMPELLGHSGVSGAFAFWDPARDICLTGSTNQIALRQMPFKLMMKAHTIITRILSSAP